MDFTEKLKINIQSSAAINQIISHETLRIRAFCSRAAADLKRELYIWNSEFGLRYFHNGEYKDEDEGEEPHEVLEWLLEHSRNEKREDFILLLEDFHPFLTPDNHKLIGRLRAFAVAVATRDISGCSVVLSQRKQWDGLLLT